MAKHLATEPPVLGNFRPSWGPRHAAEVDDFTPLRDAWATADDIKSQRREHEAKRAEES